MSLKTVLKKLLKPSKGKMVAFIAAIAFVALSAGVGASIYSHATATSSGGNCDDNAVIYCGDSGSVNTLIGDYNSGDGHNSAKSIQDIYSYSGFNSDGNGIASADINAMSNDSQAGCVTKSGDIYLGTCDNLSSDTKVATNALTGGRQDIAGSVKQDINGTVFYTRAPSVSFKEASLDALVVMKDGAFQFAIINACGNAVGGTPTVTPKPAYTILKQVRKPGDANYMGSIVTDANTAVEYKITVTSTGNAPATDINVRDSLPSNITYDFNNDGPLKDDGRQMTSSDVTDFFGSKGVQIPSLAPGDTRIFTFNAVVGQGETYKSCKWAILDNVGVMWATGLPTEVSHAYVNKQCPKPPKESVTLTCDELTATPDPNNPDNYTFVATTSATNAKTTDYDFALGTSAPIKRIVSSASSVTLTHTYAPGTYLVSFSVNGISNDGKTHFKDVTSAGCSKSITASSSPVCTAPNGNTYPQGSPQCTPTCTTPSGQVVPAGSPECTPGSTCTSPSGQTYPAGSSECQTTPTTPGSSLPATGANTATVVSLFAGISGLGAVGHWFYTIRKAKNLLG